MVSALTGLAIYLLTEVSRFITRVTGKTISMKWIVAFFSVIAWAIYYYFLNFNPEARKQVVSFVSGAFATSQGIWMLFEKFTSTQE